MNIPQLGSLHTDSHIPDWLVSEPIEVPYFNGQLLTFTLTALSEADEADVRDAVGAFLALGTDARLAASNYVFRNYRRMVDAVGGDWIDFNIAAPEAVWSHVRASEIYVSRRPRRDQLIYIQIAAECDWEPEHGLQIVYRRGSELSRVSEQDGHLTHTDACDLPEDQDRIAE